MRMLTDLKKNQPKYKCSLRQQDQQKNT
jgi:hypothetical protein